MRHTASAGFTLLEVLVASVIMAIAIAGLMGSLTTTVNNAARLTEYDRAVLLAKHKMDELQVEGSLPRNAPLQGEWDPVLNGGHKTGWQANVSIAEAPPDVAGQMPVLERIDLRVWWEDGPQRKNFDLVGFRRSVFQPLGAPPR